MRTLLLTILGCLAFTAGHAGAAAQNPAPETAGAQQDAKARGAHLRMESPATISATYPARAATWCGNLPLPTTARRRSW